MEVEKTHMTSLQFALHYMLTTYLRYPHQIRYDLPTSPDLALAPFVCKQKAAAG